MASGFELVGVEAIVAGMAAFERDANRVNQLLNNLNKTTQDLSLQSVTSFGALRTASEVAFGTMAVGALAITTAMAGITTGAVEMAATFDASIRRTAAVTGGGAAGIEALGASVRKAGSDSALGLQEIADGENSLARAGFTAREITGGLLETTTKFAEASGGNLGAAQAAKLMSESIKAFGLNAADGIRVANALTGAVNSSVIQYGDLAIILRQVAPIAAAMNISIEDLSAGIGVLGQAGISGSVAGSALKDVLVRLADPSKLAAQEFKKYGITIQDATGAILPFREIIEILNKALGDQAVATGKVTEEQRLQILAAGFGTRGVEAALALVRGGTDAFDKLRVAIGNTDVTKLASDMRDTLNKQLDVSKNLVEGLAIQLGTPLEQALSNGVKSINTFLRALDPNIPKAFGDALLTAFSGQGIAQVGEELRNAFGDKLGQVLTDVLNIFLSVRTAITDRVIPAFLGLEQAIFGGTQESVNFDGILKNVAGTIDTVGLTIARVVTIVAEFIRNLRTSHDNAQLLDGILRALVLIPIAGFIILFAPFAATLALIAVQATVLAAGIALVTEYISRLASSSQGALGQLRSDFDNLALPIKIAAGAVALFGAYLAADFAIVQIGLARTALVGLGTQALALVGQLGFLLPIITRVVIELRLMAAVITASSFSTLGSSIVAVGARMLAMLGPIGLIIAAIGLIGVAWANNWFGMRDLLDRLVPQLLGKVITLYQNINIATNQLELNLGTITQKEFDLRFAAIGAMGVIKDGTVGASAVTIDFAGFVQNVLKQFENLFGGIASGFPGVDAAIAAAKAQQDAWDASVRQTILDYERLQISLAAMRSEMDAASPGLHGGGPPSFRPDVTPGEAVTPLSQDKTPKGTTTVDIEKMLQGIQGNTHALADFLKQLYDVDHARLGGMVAELQKTRDLIVAIAQEYGKLRGIQEAIATVQTDIANITAQQNIVDLQAQQALLPLQAQLRDLDLQRLQLRQQMLPLEQQIAGIDEQIRVAQTANLALEGQILRLQLQMLPVQQQMAALDQQIALIQRPDYARQLDQARLQLQMLPIQQQMANIAQAQTESINQQLDLTQQLATLEQNRTVNQLQLQLDQTKLGLNQAFSSNNVPQILALEQQQFAVEKAMTAQKDQLAVLRDQQAITSDNNAISKAGADLQIAALQAILNPLQDQLTLLGQQQALVDATNKITVLGLEQQKALLQQVLDPLQKQLDALNNIKAAADLQTKIVVNGLEQQKAAIEALLAPMRQHMLDIQNSTDLVQANIDIITKQADIEKARYDAKLLGDKIELASLQTLEQEEQKRFDALVIHYADTLAASKVFTEKEGLEVVKRLGFWTTETDKLAQIVDSFGNVAKAADAVKAAIDKIPDHKDVFITIHTVGAIPSFDVGGVIPGPLGMPQLIIAHGGETVTPHGSYLPDATVRPGVGNAGSVTNNYSATYQVSANYANVQDEGSVRQDLSALLAMTRH